jgi:hypothetical protein
MNEQRTANNDVATIDNLMRAVYECVTCAPGAPRQWERERALYVPDAILMAGRAEGLRRYTVDEFVEAVDSYLAAGFYEREIARQEVRYGRIAHVLSTYDSRLTEDGPIMNRGVNSLQLLWQDERWWIVSIIWDSEQHSGPLPQSLLP